jgi:hypothetical protein
MNTLDRFLSTKVGDLKMKDLLEILSILKGHRSFYLPEFSDEEEQRINEILDWVMEGK